MSKMNKFQAFGNVIENPTAICYAKYHLMLLTKLCVLYCCLDCVS